MQTMNYSLILLQVKFDKFHWCITKPRYKYATPPPPSPSPHLKRKKKEKLNLKVIKANQASLLNKDTKKETIIKIKLKTKYFRCRSNGDKKAESKDSNYCAKAF